MGKTPRANPTPSSTLTGTLQKVKRKLL